MKKNLPLKNRFAKIVFATIFFVCVANFTFANKNTSNQSENLTNKSFAEDVLILTSLNRQIRSTNELGATYLLQVKNNSSIEINASVSVKNNNTEIENPDNSTMSENVDLEFSIHKVKEQSQIEMIQLKPGDSFQFEVTVRVPDNVPIERWNCAKVEITPNVTNYESVTILLHTYLPDMSKD